MASAAPSKQAARTRARVTAETMAAGQRDISVSEFFAKNRHLLGFDNPRKALLTTVKEAVDNSLDACEEAGILPEITVKLEHLAHVDESRFRITIEDNGPGIVRQQIENIFGRLLYGSKFHRLKMSRGQQGIGISAAGMYGLMTTGKPMVIVSRSRRNKPAHRVTLAMDTTRNRPEVAEDVETEDFPPHTGTRVAIELEGRYTRGKTSIEEYLAQTAIANPHAQIVFIPPAKRPRDDEHQEGAALIDEEDALARKSLEAFDRTTQVGDAVVFPRTVDELPEEPREIKPHPRGVELGALMTMLKQTEQTQLGGFLTSSFSRVSSRVSQEIADKADLTTRTWVKTIGHAEAERLYKAIQKTRIQAPPTDCLAPIGVRQMLAGMFKGVRAEFYTASTRPPAVYRGNPFLIEAAVAFGGDLPAEEPARVLRFANRVPLLYQQSACSSFKAVVETSWRNYGLSQGKAALPQAPLVVMIHMASVWVPFTSESKEAIADYDEIRKEMRLALQECGRKLGTYLRKRQKIRREGQRRDVFARYIGEVSRALHTINPELDPAELYEQLKAVADAKTELADQQLDEDGRLRKRRELEDDAVVVDETYLQAAGDDEDEIEPSANGRRPSGASADAETDPDGADEESLFGN